ncbi:hypothetical protein [Salmonella enterica]|uniref:hypothetical protein n=1 Tax=Salmonella enterica TaxID=28901 RepID=UPI00112F0FD0|nr:hypothetical protein [Salmonella enterica]ECC1654856.1 hypothetical protein [Salmonella enterica subsp. salamae]ECD9413650.1 hypothetical protein [Salmonella enterica subsp. salamae]ECF5930102.1 hypothetical protein [Salmonella enterica subsp. salamae]EDV5907295.1 hypothetical protein [Salmonella enterica subsp. salamae]
MAATKSDNLNMMRTPPMRGFCYPAIRQGYSRTCHGTVPLSDRRFYFHSGISANPVVNVQLCVLSLNPAAGFPEKPGLPCFPGHFRGFFFEYAPA